MPPNNIIWNRGHPLKGPLSPVEWLSDSTGQANLIDANEVVTGHAKTGKTGFAGTLHQDLTKIKTGTIQAAK